MSQTKSKNPKGALKGTPLKDIASTIKRTSESGNVHKASPSIMEGLKPVKKMYNEGLHKIPPEHLLTFLVPRVEVTPDKHGDLKIHGFQRPDVTNTHVRQISNELESGKRVPPPIVGIYQNALWFVDGAHRSLGSISSRIPIEVAVMKLSAEEMNQLFSDQDKNRKLNKSNTVITGTDDYRLYVQDAITASSVEDNPWQDLVSKSFTSQTRITPKQMLDFVSKYSANTLSSQVNNIIRNYPFDRDKADEAARLLKAFGNKKTNPIAYRPIAQRALIYASVTIIRRNGSRESDIKRWESWMPKFPWEQYMGIRKSKELALFLINHWNKKLKKENKIPLPDDVM